MKSPLSLAIPLFIAAPLLTTTTTHAEQANGFTIAPSVGYHMFDTEINLENDYYGSLGLGYKSTSPWAFEFTYQMGSAEFVSTLNEIEIEQLRLDLLYHFASDGKVQPFLLIGGGHERWTRNLIEVEHSIFNAGAGLKIWLNDWASLRTDMRLINDVDYERTSYAVGVGLNLLLGGSGARSEPIQQAPLDSDGDGVANGPDRCPATIVGVEVDENGCEMRLDDDQDGIANEIDACLDTSFGAKVDSTGCYIMITETKEMNLRVGFELGSSRLTPDSYTEIEPVAQFMREYPMTNVHIEGHTDDTGSTAYNQRLSQQRAEAVARALSEQYDIDTSRVTATGYGESRPIVPNTSDDNRAQNRRVTARITAQVERIAN